MELDYNHEVRARALELAIKHAATKRGYAHNTMGGGGTREIPTTEVIGDAAEIEKFILGSKEGTE